MEAVQTIFRAVFIVIIGILRYYAIQYAVISGPEGTLDFRGSTSFLEIIISDVKIERNRTSSKIWNHKQLSTRGLDNWKCISFRIPGPFVSRN